ncbi:MAG: phosphate ABC transporter permease, partial [Oscillochloris sp.]|nr:phosphate ABC transporter permease [Oscillochloris sp.]
MSTELTEPSPRSRGSLPEGAALRRNVAGRQRIGKIWQFILMGCTAIGIVILLLLLSNVVNDAFGGIAMQSQVAASEVYADREPTDLSKDELIAILNERLRARVLRNLEREKPLAEREPADLITIINTEVIDPEIVAIYPLNEYLFNRSQIEAQLKEDFPRAELSFKSWLSGSFLTNPMSSQPLDAGVRTAVLGTLWLLLITILIAFPLGIGAALYLEEYAANKIFDERTTVGRRLNALINRASGVIQTNIYNLSGVPSIIYGMLGLAIFVRAMEGFTSGSFLGVQGDSTANGRTILAAG